MKQNRRRHQIENKDANEPCVACQSVVGWLLSIGSMHCQVSLVSELCFCGALLSLSVLQCVECVVVQTAAVHSCVAGVLQSVALHAAARLLSFLSSVGFREVETGK